MCKNIPINNGQGGETNGTFGWGDFDPVGEHHLIPLTPLSGLGDGGFVATSLTKTVSENGLGEPISSGCYPTVPNPCGQDSLPV